MALGYILEQFESIEPPLPSGVVLLGHLFVLSDPRALAANRPSVQAINIMFLFSNIIVFLYDFFLYLGNQLPIINQMDNQ